MRRTGLWDLVLVMVALSRSGLGDSLLKAFPGAEGYGSCTPGGRGGRVFIVSRLDDYIPGKDSRIEGTLRAAVDAEGPRMVLFATSGTVALKGDLWIRNPYITLAGQSAPGEGICIRDYQVVLATHDIVIRHLRFRPGDVTRKEQMAVGIFGGTESILDHCSMSWAIDEVMSSFGASNISAQWCVIAEGLSKSYHPKGEHSKGSILAGRGGVSIHHCLYAHNASRNPRAHGVVLDFRNNVIYNWGYRCGYTREAPCFINMVGNTFKPGPSTKEKSRTRLFEPGDETVRMFWEGNILEGFPDETRDNSLAIAAPKPWNRKDFLALVMVKEPFSCVPVQTEPASVAFDRVLKEAGATWPRRDRIDSQLMDDVRNGTGRILDTQEDLGGWPELRSEPAELDQDEDGMPDEWEKKILREEQGDASGDADQDGYTNLEEYLNQTDPRAPDRDCQVDEEGFREYQEEAVSLSVQGEKTYAEHLASQKEKREARKREIISTLKVTLSPSPGEESKVVLVDLGGEASMEVIRIPSGSSIMGSPPEEEGQEKERPQHKVNISKPFYLASTPTTALQFRTVMGEEIRTADKTPDDFPAKETTWFEAQEFCDILSAITGQVFRLPSEAEWEYACRAGTRTAFYTGDVISTDQANFNGAEATRYNPQGVFLGKETAVKSYPANPWGLYDMPGNQAEWCQDFAYRRYSAEEVTDPIGTEDRSGRVLRGGKAGSKAWYLRSAARYSYAPEIGYGFRVVMEAER